ncbi:CaiB/BaiF CoA transferase family protein [Pedococcus sp. 5OH_020]|uniref:CaiB/BaiF CoA transferase family protein n=1 Tax=Pedococcus sp. 5OH_020 TaxID=2989814 RepID=UPI0022E9EE30|nr:CoA transferase [Pedococcus sp. 5OH_020]
MNIDSTVALRPHVTWDRDARGALSGVRVLDLSRFIAGPLCAQNLGDLGADVIKVESPGGEDARANSPAINGKALYTMMYNRNKRAVTLNSRSPEGRELLRRLAGWADVIVENFRPGTLDKMGIGYETLREINPRLIVVSISGYGQGGPYRDRVLFDCIAQAMSGVMDMNAGPDGMPRLMKMFPADTLGATQATSATLAALFHRERTGEGQVIDIAVLDSLVAALGTALPANLLFDATPEHNGNRDDFNAPANAFPVRDGFVYLHAGTAAFWSRFCIEILDRPDLVTDERFSSTPARMSNVTELEKLVTDWTMDHTGLEVEQIFERVGIPCSRVADVATAARNEQLWSRDMLFRTHDSDGDELFLVGYPAKFSGSPITMRFAPPRVGEHTEEVLEEILGLDGAEIAQLRDSGVL